MFLPAGHPTECGGILQYQNAPCCSLFPLQSFQNHVLKICSRVSNHDMRFIGANDHFDRTTLELLLVLWAVQHPSSISKMIVVATESTSGPNLYIYIYLFIYIIMWDAGVAQLSLKCSYCWLWWWNRMSHLEAGRPTTCVDIRHVDTNLGVAFYYFGDFSRYSHTFGKLHLHLSTQLCHAMPAACRRDSSGVMSRVALKLFLSNSLMMKVRMPGM